MTGRCPGLSAGVALVAVVLAAAPAVAAAAAPAGPGKADPARAYADHLRETRGILDVRTIHESGMGADGLDLVIVSAGFRPEEMGVFHGLCADTARSIFRLEPWRRYRGLVNVHAVFVADEGPDSTHLKVSGHDGHVLSCDNGLAVEYAMHAADAAGTLVLHNSDRSIASCGMWGVLVFNRGNARDPGAPVHEMGHGLAGLGDEYIQRAGPFNEPPESLKDTVNVTPVASPRLCKWHYWTVDEWPGALSPSKRCVGAAVRNFEGAGWPTGIYRPEESCMMRGSRDSFCAVCNETMEASFFRYVELLKTVEPAAEELVLWRGESAGFRVAAVDLVRERPEWLASRLELYLDGKRVASSDSGEVSFRLAAAGAGGRVHELGANLTVQCDSIRRDFGFLSRGRGWRVEVMPHARPGIAVKSRVSASARGTVDVPVGIRHDEPSLFRARMEHAPAGAMLENGRFRWRPEGKTGSWRVDFTASLGDRDAATASMEIHVGRARGADGAIEVEPPEPVDAVTGERAVLQIKASARDGGHLLFDTVDAPEGVEIDRYTGELAWTPARGQAGPRPVRIRVRSGRAEREVDALFRVRRAARPTPVSYCNTYVPDTLASLKRLEGSPVVYRRLFETLRLLRDRYARVHGPALAAAERMYDGLAPEFRANCIAEISRHAWAFTDKPGVLAWMRRIAEDAGTEEARRLVAKLDLMAELAETRRIETEGGPEDLAPLARRLLEAPAGAVRSALVMAVRGISGRAGDEETEACQRAILSVLNREKGPGRAALVALLPLARTPTLTKALAALARDTDRDVAAAAGEALDYLAGLGATDGYVTSWMIAGPYTAAAGASLFDEAFAPEKAPGEAGWRPCELEAPKDGAYVVDLGRVLGGDNRAAYMKTVLRSARAQEVLFEAGSDDGIRVWLDGELVHSRNAARPVRPGEDRFRARLKAGDNELVCKIVQHTGGWGACVRVLAADGGCALGVRVPALSD